MKCKMQNAQCTPSHIAAFVVASMCVATLACSSAASAGAETRVSGVYANTEGNASVEFMSLRPGPGRASGRAHFSLHGVGGECTFTQQDRQVLLTCAGETTAFTIEDDGALKGPADSFLTRLRRKG